jgi:hypothetical protein
VYNRIKTEKIKDIMDQNAGVSYFKLTMIFFFLNLLIAAGLQTSTLSNIPASVDADDHDLLDTLSSLVPVLTELLQGMFHQFLRCSFFVFLTLFIVAPENVSILSEVLLDSSRLVEDTVHEHHVGLDDVDNRAFLSIFFLTGRLQFLL